MRKSVSSGDLCKYGASHQIACHEKDNPRGIDETSNSPVHSRPRARTSQTDNGNSSPSPHPATVSRSKSRRHFIPQHSLEENCRIAREIHQKSLRSLKVAAQPVLVRSPTDPYYAYHLKITSMYFKQKWVVAKRYSEIYRFRKHILERLKSHGRNLCHQCSHIHEKLQKLDFPQRIFFFKVKESQLIKDRTLGIGKFVKACFELLASAPYFCKQLERLLFYIKEYFHFPTSFESQHIRAVQSLVPVTADMEIPEQCSICLSGWDERITNFSPLDLATSIQPECSHIFHHRCIAQWYRTRFDCPLCRAVAGKKR